MKLRTLASSPLQGVSHDPQILKRVLLRAGEVPHLTQFAQAPIAPGQHTAPHAHPDMYEIFWIEEGRGTLNLDGVEHPLLPGTCVVVEPGEVHELCNTGLQPLVVTYFGVAVLRARS